MMTIILILEKKHFNEMEKRFFDGTICHKPGTSAEKTKTIPAPALNGHLGHGDYIEPCV